MKILIVTNSSSGLYNFRRDLIKELIKQRNIIEVITLNDGYIQELKELGCNLHILEMDRRGKNLMSELKLLLRYKNFIKKIDPDKVVSYTIKPNIYCGLITRILGVNFYPNITGLGTAFQKEGFFKKIIIYMYKIAFKKSKKVFFENKSNKEIFIKEKISKEENSVCLNGAGVNIDEFKFCKLPSFETINFLFMGRIMKEKGVDELFEAIKHIKEKYKKIRFIILGSLEEDYEDCILKLNKKNILEYYGEVNDVKPYIKESHCILLPSYHEGMSNTLLEGAAMGRALITSDIPGCREAVIDNESGFLHKIKNAKDLECKIEKFINLSDKEKINFGEKSRKIIEEKFNKKEVVKKTIENIFNS